MNTKRKKKKQIINPLLQGGETEERFNIILGLSSIRSSEIIQALRHHYVHGVSTECLMVDAGNFNRSKNILGAIACQIERIKEIDGVING